MKERRRKQPRVINDATVDVAVQIARTIEAMGNRARLMRPSVIEARRRTFGQSFRFSRDRIK